MSQRTERTDHPDEVRASPTTGVGRRALLAAECAALFVLPPLAVRLGWIDLALAMPLLLLAGVTGIVVIAVSPAFRAAELWRARAAVRELPRILVMWLGFCGLVIAATLAVERGLVRIGELPRDGELLFSFPRRAPLQWLTVMIGYPILSAYAQEVLYRVLFFRRYAPLFGSPAALIWASAALFAWLHLPFQNWLAIALSVPGGLLFAWTYHRTRSGLAVSIEHALYGNALFTIGLGYFFWTGSVANAG